jgi:hypothetical protein
VGLLPPLRLALIDDKPNHKDDNTMDPNACLADILESLSPSEDPDPKDVAEKLRNLADWIDRGGFMPLVEDFSLVE